MEDNAAHILRLADGTYYVMVSRLDRTRHIVHAFDMNDVAFQINRLGGTLYMGGYHTANDITLEEWLKL